MEVSQPGNRAGSLWCKRAGSPNGLARIHVIASNRASPASELKTHIGACAVSLHRRVTRIKMADKVSKSAAAATKLKEKTVEEKSVLTAAKFKWNDEMVRELLDSLREFKATMEFNNFDFNADKPRQYEEVRRILSKKYSEQPELFGPDSNAAPDEKNKVFVKTGYKRVMEKIKALRQKFSHAVTAGSRSGSGKLVLEFYDDLVNIWGGSASTKPLQYGRESSSNDAADAAFDEGGAFWGV